MRVRTAGMLPPGSPATMIRRTLLRVRSKRSSAATSAKRSRSEEHTSELQSHHDLVCRLLLEKKKNNKTTTHNQMNRQETTTSTTGCMVRNKLRPKTINIDTYERSSTNTSTESNDNCTYHRLK